MKKETIEDLILRYGIVCGKRKSEKQKVNFLKIAKKQLEQSGFKTNVTKSSMKFMKSETNNFYNLYAGDLQHAKTLYISYYDTPIKYLIPQKQYAFETGYSKLNVYVNLLITFLIIVSAIAILYFGIVPGLNEKGFLSIWGACALCICLIFFFIVKHMRDGITNRFNMVRNTSSLISLFLLAEELEESEKGKIAFAFIDGGTNNRYGQKMLEEYLGKKKPIRIYLDSIGNNGVVQCFTNKKIPNVFEQKNLHELSKEHEELGDILLTAGELENNKVFIPNANTNKDRNIEVSALMNVTKVLLSMNKQLEE